MRDQIDSVAEEIWQAVLRGIENGSVPTDSPQDAVLELIGALNILEDLSEERLNHPRAKGRSDCEASWRQQKPKRIHPDVLRALGVLDLNRDQEA